MFQVHFTWYLNDGQSAGKDMPNGVVFNFRRNAGSDWISLTEVDREFQARDVAAGKARSPVVTPRVGGTKSVDVGADRRRRRHPRFAATGRASWLVNRVKKPPHLLIERGKRRQNPGSFECLNI